MNFVADIGSPKTSIYRKDFKGAFKNDDVPKITMDFFTSFYQRSPVKE
jgi:hypothetical protein